MNLNELGSRLKEERQRQGLSITEVMDVTKISRRNIMAIESGDEKELPHPVYAKGFVKIYSKVLGFNPDEFGEAFSQCCPIESEDEDERSCQTLSSDYNENDVVSSIKNKKSPAPFFLILLVLVIIAAGIVYYLNSAGVVNFFSGDKKVVSLEKEPSKSPASLEKTGGKSLLSESASPSAADYNSKETLDSGKDLKEISPSADSEEDTSVAETKSDAAVKESEPSAPSASAEIKTAKLNSGTENTALAISENKITVTAKKDEACWIEIVSDNNVSRTMILKDGESVAISYKQKLHLKLGNSAGVTIKKNGSDYSFKAVNGRVTTLTFS